MFGSQSSMLSVKKTTTLRDTCSGSTHVAPFVLAIGFNKPLNPSSQQQLSPEILGPGASATGWWPHVTTDITLACASGPL